MGKICHKYIEREFFPIHDKILFEKKLFKFCMIQIQNIILKAKKDTVRRILLGL